MNEDQRREAEIAADRLENIASSLAVAVTRLHEALNYLHTPVPDGTDWRAPLGEKLQGELRGVAEHLPYCCNLIDAMRTACAEKAAETRQRLRTAGPGNGGVRGRTAQAVLLQRAEAAALAPRPEIKVSEYDR